MEKSKYDFISEILENRKLKQDHTDKIARLALREIAVENRNESELLKRIEKIEKKLDELKGSQITKAGSSTFTIKNVGNPKHVADFMSLFNKRDGLKYLTHDYDENDSFMVDTFLISANEVFVKKTKELNIPKSLWRIVKQFAFDSQQTEWTSISEDYKKPINIKVGWASKELRDWSKHNRLHPIRNDKYKKIIDDFKRITRIEPQNLSKIIDSALNRIFGSELFNFHIEQIEVSKADFYSHVTFLKIALESIFEEIKKRSDSREKKKLSIQYKRVISTDGYFLRKIIITHYNSYPQKELSLLLNEWHEKGNMGKIREKLNGYCHWSVETVADEFPTRINILKETDTPGYELIDHVPAGFVHILTFYYK